MSAKSASTSDGGGGGGGGGGGAARASGYKFVSHLCDDDAETAVRGAIEQRKATHFARTMSRVVKNVDGVEARRLFREHSVLQRYVTLAERLRAEHYRKKADGADGGVIAHIGKVMGWPVSDADWAAERARGLSWVTVRRAAVQRGRARSSKAIGVRADDEIKATIRGERVLASKTHRYTKWFLMYLYQRQWLACDAQVPLWPANDDTTVCTWADVLCYDLRARRFVLLELKTGYAFAYRTSLARAAATHGGALPDSAYNRHQMQLGWMYRQLARELTTIGETPLDAYVVRVNSLDGVPEPFALDDWSRHYFDGTYDALNERNLARFLEPLRAKKQKVADE